MVKEYSREQFWKLYEKLPKELKETIFSEETAESIWNVCIKNGVEDERISEIAKYTGRVLLGILPLTDFQETLEKELKLKGDMAKKIAQEISRFVFHPIKVNLEEIYKTEAALLKKPTKITKTTKEKPAPLKKPAVSEKPDVYREPIE